MKRYLLAIVATLSTFCLCAQDVRPANQPTNEPTSRDAKRRVVFGIKAGVNRSNVYNVDGTALAPTKKQGFAGGVFLALPVGGLLGIQPELILQQKGFEGLGTMGGQQYAVSRTTTHVDIPLQLQVKFFKWFSFLVGPNISFLLNQNDNFSYYGGLNASAKTDLETASLRKSTWGTIFGIDFNFGHLVLSGRSGWDVSPSPVQVYSGVPNYRNRWLQGTVGYRFY